MSRSHCRIVRSRGKHVLTPETKMVSLFDYQQSADLWQTWTSRSITLKSANDMVEAGTAVAVRRFHEGRVRVVGYMRTRPENVGKKSPASLTFSTMRAVINFEPANAAADRLNYAERRQMEKFLVWPKIWDGKNKATVGPRMSEAEERLANAILDQGRLVAA